MLKAEFARRDDGYAQGMLDEEEPGRQRRHPDDVTAVVEPEGVRLSFGLPAGSYATVLLAELMKVAVPEGEDEEAEPDA